MRIGFILVLFWLARLRVAWTQTNEADQAKITVNKIDGSVPGKDAYIIKYYVDKATSESGYETGSLHIVYSDKTEVVKKLPPKQKRTEDDVAFNEVGIDEPKLAGDKRTIAWTEDFENCCTSYSIPLVLAVYRSGKNIVEVQEGDMVWDWMFFDGGKRIAAVWGAVHLSDIGDYQLNDTETGQVIDEALGNAEIEGKNGTFHGLGSDAPAWAKELEKLNR
ncbi:MAG: hypothetical protein WBV69_15070 [Candidatus Sulfotelmatobacter sp.]